MHKSTQMIEKINGYLERAANIKTRALGIQAENAALDADVDKWMKEDLGMSGNCHITEVIKAALEKSHDDANTTGQIAP